MERFGISYGADLHSYVFFAPLEIGILSEKSKVVDIFEFWRARIGWKKGSIREGDKIRHLTSMV